MFVYSMMQKDSEYVKATTIVTECQALKRKALATA